MGDGVLIYFGYPEAHEDDAERAGLAVIDAVGRLATQEPLNVRIGIASRLVVVGDLIGAGAAQERGVVGETPNLAARLHALARPDTLVVADSTRRQIGTLFEIEDLGPQPLAGFAGDAASGAPRAQTLHYQPHCIQRALWVEIRVEPGQDEPIVIGRKPWGESPSVPRRRRRQILPSRWTLSRSTLPPCPRNADCGDRPMHTCE
jgi:Adenylate and Guanylate cyclase catalytic domain